MNAVWLIDLNFVDLMLKPLVLECGCAVESDSKFRHICKFGLEWY